MKKQFLTGLLLLATLVAGRAAVYYQGTGVSGDVSVGSVTSATILDGNPANLTVNSMNLSAYATGNNWSLATLTVTLNISGGNNNGLYAYLVGPNGSTTVTLMNQPGYAVDGFGATGAGMNITLQDAATAQGSIQYTVSGSALSGAYNAAGTLSDFNGLNPNGTWTLYFADTLAGGGNATLNGWSLNVDAVPEPVNMALGIFGALMGTVVIWRKLKTGKLKTEPGV